MAWSATPLTPWDYDKSYVDDTSGLLPKLELLLPSSEVLVDIGENKVNSLKVIKTKPLLFPAENEGPPEGGCEPLHKEAGEPGHPYNTCLSEKTNHYRLPEHQFIPICCYNLLTSKDITVV